MFFVLIIAVIFALVSIYFYFRSERLQQELVKLKQETAQTRKDNKQLVDATALVAAKQEEFYQLRFNHLVELAKEKNAPQQNDLDLISPLFSNYASIFRECLLSKGQVKIIVEKCFESYSKGSFKKFLRFISSNEIHIKRMWSSNNLKGYLSLVEALLIDMQKTLEEQKALPKKDVVNN